MARWYPDRRLPAALLLLLLLAGCSRKFTRARFELITPGADERADVRAILGKPEFTAEDVWYYEDPDRHYAAQIFFDSDGRVLTKEWLDARRGEWEGGSPFLEPPAPAGPQRVPTAPPPTVHTRTRRIDDD